MNHTAGQTIEYKTCSASALISSSPRAGIVLLVSEW